MIVVAISENVWFALITVVAVVAVLAIASRLSNKRAAALQKTAAELGFSYERKGAAFREELDANLHLLNLSKSASLENVMRSADGLVLFDYRYLEGTARSGRNVAQTVAAVFLPGANLPGFHLSPENLLQKIVGVFGYQMLRFNSHPAFSKRFVLRGRDEAAVRALFSVALLDYFQALPAKPAWSIEGAGSWLLVYHAGKKLRPDELQALASVAASTARVFQRAMDALDLRNSSSPGNPPTLSARAAIN